MARGGRDDDTIHSHSFQFLKFSPLNRGPKKEGYVIIWNI